MSEPQTGRYDSIARRWLAIVERRHEHFVELADTGRWRHYYTKTEFLDEMRKVMRVRDQWATLAGTPPGGRDVAAGEVSPGRNGRQAPPLRVPPPPWRD
jgi:uncharacterized repeat protein (TIGR03809 family)